VKEIVIVGAGGTGRELLQWIKDYNIANPNVAYYIKGFIDDNPNALDSYECEYRIIGSIKDCIPAHSEVFACGMYSPKDKERIVDLLKSRGAYFESIIHPTAVICDNSYIGEGFVAYPNSYISVNVSIKNFVTIMSTAIGYDVEIGNYSTVCSDCGISAKTKLGERVFVGNNAVILSKRKIGDDCFIRREYP
jgi:acetyltransferase-like isoleucine patch superfamily enzyme